MYFDYYHKVKINLLSKGYNLTNSDLNRPWGAFFYIDEKQAQKFSDEFFNDGNKKIIIDGKVSPKMLIIKPKSRLSWQYHNRRSEIWQVYKGRVGVVISEDNDERKMKVLNTGSQVKIKQGLRHRIVGLEDYAQVAEIWQHTNSLDSDENDIIRLDDDFGRQ